MNVALWKKVLAAAVVLTTLGMVAGSGTLSIGQEAKAPKTEKKAKGRLPPYFSDIVTEEQRQEIYKIRASYEKQIDDLESQLAALRDKEMAEIEKLLDADQKEQLEKARVAAATKKKKKSSDSTTAEEAPKPAADAPAATAKPAAKKP